MRRVIQYKIVKAKKAEDLAQLVNENISNGFEPFGSLILRGEAPNIHIPYFHQPMVEYEYTDDTVNIINRTGGLTVT